MMCLTFSFVFQATNRHQLSSKFSNFSSSNSSMTTLEKKSPVTVTKLLHQQSLPTPKAASTHHLLQQQMSEPAQPKRGGSVQVSIEMQSDKSSLDSVELEPINDCECDRGFGSMSSTDRPGEPQKSGSQDESHQKEVKELKQEVTKLKCDKLDLLRQNVVSPSRAMCS